MEKALKIESYEIVTDAELMKQPGVSRIYFGHEFCDRLLPSEMKMRQMIKLARKNKKEISFLTPLSSEAGLGKTKKLLSYLDDEDEIVVNDYGILNVVSSSFSNPIVIGRVLGRNVLSTLTILQNNRINPIKYLDLLSLNIKRIEMDYFNCNSNILLLKKHIGFSFYAEAPFWTITRRCAFNRNSRSMDKFKACNRECLDYRIIAYNNKIRKKFIIDGNKILDIKDDVQRKIDRKAFNRIVFPPQKY